jgi:hypothetical protein
MIRIKKAQEIGEVIFLPLILYYDTYLISNTFNLLQK